MSNFTDADLATLDRAIASGALKVEYTDHKVEFRSLKEMMQARDFMERSIGNTSSQPNHTTFVTSKGL